MDGSSGWSSVIDCTSVLSLMSLYALFAGVGVGVIGTLYFFGTGPD